MNNHDLFPSFHIIGLSLALIHNLLGHYHETSDSASASSATFSSATYDVDTLKSRTISEFESSTFDSSATYDVEKLKSRTTPEFAS